MEHKVFFEIYGKKMVAVIDAKNEDEAIRKLKDKIIIHKVECPIIPNAFKDIFGMFEK